MKNGAKVLIFDIETAPLLSYHWGLWDQNISLGQIKEDWFVLSWAAKWLGDSPRKTMYQDQSKIKNIENDKKLLQEIWNLLNEADVVITQNGIKFDSKKLNARFALNGMGPPSPYKHIDTCKIASRKFAFTSNKLAYLSEKLNKKYKKLDHGKFPGFELHKQCLKGNPKAWVEMKKYNIYDVLATEELYETLKAWDNTVNFNLYTDNITFACNCGSHDLTRRGYNHSTGGKYQRYQCNSCGAWSSSKKNLLSKDKRESLWKKL